MGQLLEPPDYYGTYDGICVYRMNGKDFLRSASSLTRKRVKKDAAFRNTRAWAARMATASRLASAVYAMLPPYRRKFPFYRKLTGQAMQLLKAGQEEGAVVAELMIAIRLPQRKPRKKAVIRTIPMIYSRSCVDSPKVFYS
ncbi:MAG TPA: hypothetical protein VLD19_03785 [Chitinophagaceae bacterium]|nr:hypothetical protein [Chitinophagaceae bacterium]